MIWLVDWITKEEIFLNVWLPVEFLLWWYKSNQERKQVVSQLPFCKIFTSVFVFGRVSFAVGCPCHMPGRTTRKCKETLLQVRERLTREQANRTSKRFRELLGPRDSSSESDSEEEQDGNIDGSRDTLSLLRRDLYLGLLCLLLLIVLQNFWVRSTCLRNWARVPRVKKVS